MELQLLRTMMKELLKIAYSARGSSFFMNSWDCVHEAPCRSRVTVIMTHIMANYWSSYSNHYSDPCS